MYDLRPAAVAGRVRLCCDLSRLIRNYRLLSARLLREGTEPIAVLKANAYGHGAARLGAALAAEGARRFAVSSVEEGLALREALPVGEILVLGYTPPAAAPYAAEAGLTLTVHDLAYAKTVSRLLRGQPLSIHIKLNSGMNRMGFPLTADRFDETVERVAAITALAPLVPRGIFSHLATADAEGALLTRQLGRFRAALIALGRRGIRLPAHLAASAAVLSGRARGLPLARLGLSLYGYAPTGEEHGLLPIARLECDVAQITHLPPGEAIGYGGSYVTDRRETVGLLPIGYADGLPRTLTGASVRIAGQRCPIVGRVSMDAATVLLRGVPRGAAHTATLFGEESEDLFRLAEAAGTIPYELLARLGTRIDRKYYYGEANRTDHTE